MRAIPTYNENSPVEEWMAAFLLSLERDDLAPATVRGYRYDLLHFLAWRRTVQAGPFVIQDLAEHDLIAYRQQMVAAGRRPAAINRRLEALRRLCRWARETGDANPTHNIACNTLPCAFTRMGLLPHVERLFAWRLLPAKLGDSTDAAGT